MSILKSSLVWLKGLSRAGHAGEMKSGSIQYPKDTGSILELVEAWNKIYTGKEPWVKGQKFRKLRAAKFLCEYISNLNLAEYTINVDEPLAEHIVNQILKDNNFALNIRNLDEKKEALGGACLKVFTDGQRISIDFVPASNFIPLTIENGCVTEGVFFTVKKSGNATYTLLEIHTTEFIEKERWVVIENKLFRSGDPGCLGSQVPLGALAEYSTLEERTEFCKKTPMFAYIYPAIANNLTDMPYGISRFANAIDTLEDIDLAANGIRIERSSSRKKIFASKYMLKRNLTGSAGNSELRYDEDTDIYQILDIDSKENQMPDAFDPQYRINEFVQDINTQLNLLCLQTGLSAGSLSFDEKTGIKTATEIKSENSKTFRTVIQNQEIIKPAIRLTVENIIFIAQLPEIALLPPGRTYGVLVSCDDSVTPDRDSYIKEGVTLVSSRLISQKHFLTGYYGLSDDAAVNMLKEIKEENPSVPDVFGM